jgi:hypothetical protein
MSRRGDISNSRLLIIGHRGASAHATENTLAAFAQAFEITDHPHYLKAVFKQNHCPHESRRR